MNRTMGVGEVLRYTKGDAVDRLVHPHRSYHQLQRDPTSMDRPTLQLERGINAPSPVRAPDGPRLAVVALRSTPAKAGTSTTPWTDDVDPEHGHALYHGDHKPDSGELGSTRGDKLLMEAWRAHRAPTAELRVTAPPILLFRTVTVTTDRGPTAKGFVEFCGLGVLERLVPVQGADPISGVAFPNFEAGIVLLSLGEADHLDWRWIDARRDARLTGPETLEHAPTAWLQWIIGGPTALDPIRRTTARLPG